MGCKESKHKVAAGNIIITPSPSKRHSNNDIVGNGNGNGNSNSNSNNNDLQKIPENPTKAISPVQKQESLKANVDSNARNSDKGTANVNAKESKNAKGDSYMVVDEKVRESELIVEVFNDKEIKKENVGEELNKGKELGHGVEEKGKGNLVCDDSPNNFFSSRKDDETIEGIISEGISGTSVYYTPQKEGASEDQSKKLENIGEEEKESVAETRNETKTACLEEAGNVTEGNNSVKEAEELAADLVEENPSETADNLVNEPAKAAITIAKENPIEAGEEKLVEVITEAGIKEETRVKEDVDAANATKEHLILHEKVANVAEGNKAKAEEAIVDTSKQNPVKEEAGPIVEESKGAVNKISSANEENVTETSEEDSKTK